MPVPKNAYACNICQKTFNNGIILINHVESRHSEGPLISGVKFWCLEIFQKLNFFWQISALAFKMGQIKKIMPNYWAN